MNFWSCAIVMLIILGLLTLIYVVGGIMESVITYVKHTRERKKSRRKDISPMAKYRKGSLT